MTQVDDVVSRTLRDWLVPPDDQPIRFRLTDDLPAGSFTLSYDPSLFPPEVEDILGPGTLVEAGYEQLFLGTVDEETGTVANLVRGVNGTSPADHTSGSLVTLTPTFTRQGVFDAVVDCIAHLHPPLFRVRSTPLTVSSLWNEAPADMVAPISFTFIDHFGMPAEVPVQFTTLFPDSPTGNAVVVQAFPGIEGHLNYRARFTSPSSPDDELADLGVEESWVQLLAAGATHRLVTSRDIEAATQEFLTRQLAQQGFPVPSASRIRDGIVGYYEYLLNKASRDQSTEHPIALVRTFPQMARWP